MPRSILLVGTFCDSSSHYHTVSHQLAEKLEDAGWKVFITSRNPKPAARLADMLQVTWKLRRNYSIAHVDIYSGRSFLWAESVCFLLRLAKVPYVLTLRGGGLPLFAATWPRRVRRLLLSAAAVTTPSEYLRQYLHFYRSDLIVLQNPIELSCFPFRNRCLPTPRIIWVRAFHKIYNPTLAPKVIALLSSSFPDVHLTMIGPNKGDGSLEDTKMTAKRLGISQNINITGAIEHEKISTWLNQSDIFLNTTNYDNTPNSVIEAMSCGLCVVSTNVGGISYLLDNEIDSLLVSPDDPEQMAKAVRRVFNERGLAARLSLQARNKAALLDWSVLLPRWIALFESLG